MSNYENSDLFQPGIKEEILAEYKRITASMERLEAGITDIHTSIAALQRSLPAIIKYELRLDRLERTVNRWRPYLCIYTEKRWRQ